jgi:hypothetical protein
MIEIPVFQIFRLEIINLVQMFQNTGSWGYLHGTKHRALRLFTWHKHRALGLFTWHKTQGPGAVYMAQNTRPWGCSHGTKHRPLELFTWHKKATPVRHHIHPLRKRCADDDVWLKSELMKTTKYNFHNYYHTTTRKMHIKIVWSSGATDWWSDVQPQVGLDVATPGHSNIFVKLTKIQNNSNKF